MAATNGITTLPGAKVDAPNHAEGQPPNILLLVSRLCAMNLYLHGIGGTRLPYGPKIRLSL